MPRERAVSRGCRVRLSVVEMVDIEDTYSSGWGVEKGIYRKYGVLKKVFISTFVFDNRINSPFHTKIVRLFRSVPQNYISTLQNVKTDRKIDLWRLKRNIRYGRGDL